MPLLDEIHVRNLYSSLKSWSKSVTGISLSKMYRPEQIDIKFLHPLHKKFAVQELQYYSSSDAIICLISIQSVGLTCSMFTRDGVEIKQMMASEEL